MGAVVLTEIQGFTKRLVRQAINALGGNRAAAEFTGIEGSELSRFASDDVDRHISLWRAMDLDAAAGDVMLKAWARRRGFEILTADEKTELVEGVTKLVGKLAHATADLQSQVLEAATDGVATNNEIKETEARAGALIGAAEDTVRAVTRLRAVS
ncbi:hypothetical protein H8A97_12900 [Bradyrhizobium sp. Arg62]|uniref:hypothetical protein n=1 Tax=Bradyrhizobium brasilense TaxID=1419277 RepID=UPI001E4A67BE|nr:hypothetical protein [Bradyrhizobium brasilense]MCC8945971.1 hypothetical protein [Bradyrhizobium brasilense]